MILILGVTASGKSSIAYKLAEKIDAEIISIDSMKVYRRMDIGTAKPPKQWREKIIYHLIDIIEPSEAFSVGRFVALADEAIEKIKSKNKPVIAVGGTALYIKTLLCGLFDGPAADENTRKKLKNRAKSEGLDCLYNELATVDPKAAESINPNDEKRIIRALEVYQLIGKPISSLQQQWDNESQNSSAKYPAKAWTIIGLRREKTEENKRINARVKKMVDAGFVDEVKSLLAEEKPLSKQAASAIGYAEIIEHLKGNLSLDDAIELIKKNTRRFAKSQRTWFKSFKNINWLDLKPDEPLEQILSRTCQLINKNTVNYRG
jgi:tRNA dimethylallyltransferase